jgi:hypothetical protein
MHSAKQKTVPARPQQRGGFLAPWYRCHQYCRRSRYESYRDERSRHRPEIDPSAAIRLPIWPPALTAWGASAGRKPLPRLLAEAPQSDELGIVTAFGPEHVTITTRFLSSSLVAAAAATVLRREAQREEIGTHAARKVAFFGRVNFSVERYRRDHGWFPIGTWLPNNSCL